MGRGRYKQIYDNIYGYIDFDRDLFDCILKDPFFLRLHNLKQMGLTYYVYPDALHTRYAHSLGVYSAVNRIMDAQKYFNNPVDITPTDKEKIMFSALLHDIGHLPLSHTIEAALEEFSELEKTSNINNTSFLDIEESFFKNDLLKSNDSVYRSIKKPRVALHEKLGEYVLSSSKIASFLESKGIAPLEISTGFKGDIGYAQVNEFESTSFYNRQIRNFLHSQLDADRIDYLLRDSGFSGLKSGSFDIDKLLSSIVYDADANYGIDESSIRALEQFFISRFVAYCQIVGNKKVMAFEYMAKDFYLRLLKLRKQQKYHLSIRLYSYSDLTTDVLIHRPSEFLAFTDDYFFSLIREVISKEDSINNFDPIVVKYAKMITEVQPLTSVTYFETFEDRESEPCFINSLKQDVELQMDLSESTGIPLEEIIIPKPLKIALYKEDEDPIQVFQSRDQIKYHDISQSPASLLSYLKAKTYIIYRVYTFNKDNAEKLRVRMKELAKDYRFKGDL